MLDLERAAVRYFLDLDMSRHVDISIQDKLARGLVEAPRANIYIPAVIESSMDDVYEGETHSQMDGLRGPGTVRSGMAGTVRTGTSAIGSKTQSDLGMYNTSFIVL